MACRTGWCLLLRQREGLLPARTARDRAGIQPSHGNRDTNGGRPRASSRRQRTGSRAQQSRQTEERSRGRDSCSSSGRCAPESRRRSHVLVSSQRLQRDTTPRRQCREEANNTPKTRKGVLMYSAYIRSYIAYCFLYSISRRWIVRYQYTILRSPLALTTLLSFSLALSSSLLASSFLPPI